MEYHSIRQLEELCKTEQKPVWKIVLKAEQTETDETEKQIFERMRQMYHEMMQSFVRQAVWLAGMEKKCTGLM